MKASAPITREQSCKTQIIQAEARIEQAEARSEQARTRTELAETRTEQAESRTEAAKTRTEQAESRAEQAETTLEQIIHPKASSRLDVSRLIASGRSGNSAAEPESSIEKLTSRQREILQMIAEGQNTKSIAQCLSISPKTVEYHRMKLMAGLNVHDIPGLVRLAMRVGLIPAES